MLTFKKDGYKDVNMEIERKFDIGTTVVGNIFFWALLGIIVDTATGAAYTLTPADLQANMDELEASGCIPKEMEVDENKLHVVMLTQEEWEEVLEEKLEQSAALLQKKP